MTSHTFKSRSAAEMHLKFNGYRKSGKVWTSQDGLIDATIYMRADHRDYAIDWRA